MENTHSPDESNNAFSGISPGFSHRNPGFSGQSNKPIKPTSTETCSSDESENTTVRRNPAFSGKPNKEGSEEAGAQPVMIPRTCRKTDREEDKETALSGRERLKRHREEVAGKVSIPESWGKEGLLKNRMDLSALTSNQVFSAQAALMADSTEARGVSRKRLRIESSC